MEDSECRPVSQSGAGSTSGTDWTEVVELWVKRVVDFSSQYNTTSWAANMVIGEPRVFPRYGDIAGAWAQGELTAEEYIVVEFDERLFVNDIEIYETLNAGAVVKIFALEPTSSDWVLVWQADNLTPQAIQSSRCFKPPLKEVDFSSNQLKLVVNCMAAQTWCEIDAIKIKGTKVLLPQPPPLTSLSDNLRQLINSDTYSDVTFDLDGQYVFSHRAILAARSSYFKTLLSNNKDLHEPISMKGISYCGFIALMHFIYTNSYDNTVLPLHLVEVIRVADKFSLDGAKILAYHQLCRVFDVDNVVEIYRDVIDNLPRLVDVEETCLNFIARNLNRVSKSESFSSLPHDVMLHIVQETAARLSL